MSTLGTDPREWDWQFGPIPPVEDVAYDCVIMLTNKVYAGLVTPWGNNMNPLRWCDSSRHPHWGTDRPEGWWCYLAKGSQPRPEGVVMWEEKYGG